MAGDDSRVDRNDSDSGEPDGLAEVKGTFDAPWQARAFAVAVAMTDESDLSWDAFQDRLAAEVERSDPEGTLTDVDTGGGTGTRAATGIEATEAIYYEQWLTALSRLLIDANVLSAEEVAARAREFAEGKRTAEEWVDGERDHAHGDGHDHPH